MTGGTSMKQHVSITIASCLVCVFFIDLANAREITITKKHGQNERYDTVVEYHESTGLFGWGEGRSTLDCSNPGSSICEFQNMPRRTVQVASNDLIDIVNSKILLGILQGVYNDTYTSEDGTILRHAEWTATDVHNATINGTLTLQ